MPRTYEPIATVTTSSSATLVTLAFNAAGYRDLIISINEVNTTNGGSAYVGFSSSGQTDNITFNNRNASQRSTTLSVQNYSTLYGGQGVYTRTDIFTNFTVDVFNTNGGTRQGVLMKTGNATPSWAQSNIGITGGGASSTVALVNVLVKEWSGYQVAAGTVITVWGLA